MKLNFSLVTFIFCCLSSVALANDVSKSQCLKDAAQARNTAVVAAQDAFRDSQTSCRGPCFEGCKNTFETCVGPFRTTSKECVNAAELAFATSWSACQTSTNCGTPAKCYANRDFQTCLVDPRVLRRQSVQACLTAEKDGIKNAGCHSARKTCNKACEPKK